MKISLITQVLHKWLRKYWLPSIIRTAVKDMQEQNRIENARIIYRIDKQTRLINNLLMCDQKIYTYTFISQPELSRMVRKLKGETFSQYREDLLIIKLFDVIGVEKPSYIDIGAHHPRNLSNTALLNKNGGIGINIEANPFLFKNFQEERPKDVNVNCGIGPLEGELLFYICSDATLSTFNKDQAEILKRKNIVISSTMAIKMMRLDRLLDEKWGGICPNFLSIDIEGMDYSVLATVDYNRYRPDIICVEINTHDKLMRIVEIEFLLFDNGYFHFGDIGGGIEGRNAIFIDKKHFDKLSVDFYNKFSCDSDEI